jgi:hypothetical protein
MHWRFLDGNGGNGGFLPGESFGTGRVLAASVKNLINSPVNTVEN